MYKILTKTSLEEMEKAGEELLFNGYVPMGGIAIRVTRERVKDENSTTKSAWKDIYTYIQSFVKVRNSEEDLDETKVNTIWLEEKIQCEEQTVEEDCRILRQSLLEEQLDDNAAMQNLRCTLSNCPKKNGFIQKAIEHGVDPFRKTFPT